MIEMYVTAKEEKHNSHSKQKHSNSNRKRFCSEPRSIYGCKGSVAEKDDCPSDGKRCPITRKVSNPGYFNIASYTKNIARKRHFEVEMP